MQKWQPLLDIGLPRPRVVRVNNDRQALPAADQLCDPARSRPSQGKVSHGSDKVLISRDVEGLECVLFMLCTSTFFE